MRLSLAAAACAVSMALLAGCSSQSQGPGGTLPSAGSSQSVHHGGVQFTGIPQFPKGHMTVKQIFQWMIDGKMVPAIPREALERQLASLNHPRVHHAKKGGGAAIWSNEAFDYTIQGENKTATANAGATIDTDDNNSCYNSFDLKVDKKRNIWGTCYESGSDVEGGAGEWDKAGNAVTTYQGGCPSNIPASQCEVWYAFPNSVATSNTDVFVSDEYFENGYDCTGYGGCYDYGYGTGYAWWPKNNPSAQSTIINIYEVPFACGATDTDTCIVYDTSYFDVDNSGNLWGYAYGYDETSGTEGTGIIEITNPTTSPTISNPLAFGSVDGWNDGYWGTVDISNKGKVLNAVDPYTATVLRWSLPSLTPMSSLGGTSGDGWCEPVLGGLGKGSKTMVISDACYDDQMDLVKVKTNGDSTGTDSSIDDNYGDGAAYSHSDK